MSRPCPKCKTGSLARRNGRNGPFYGCTNFFDPAINCRYTEPVDEEDEDGDDSAPATAPSPPPTPQPLTNAAIPTLKTPETLSTAELLRLAASCLEVIEHRVQTLAKEEASKPPKSKTKSKPTTRSAAPPLPRYDPAIPALFPDEYFEDDEWKILDEADPPY